MSRKDRKSQRRQARKRFRQWGQRDNIHGPIRTGPSDYTLRRRADELIKCIKLYPEGVALSLAERDEAGWHFGRLYLVGAIDRHQKWAAERLDRTVSTYRRLLNRHSIVKSNTGQALNKMLSSSKGSGSEDLSPQAEKRFRKAEEEYDKVIGVLDDRGEKVKEAIMRALEYDEITDLDLIREGLDAIRTV